MSHKSASVATKNGAQGALPGYQRTPTWTHQASWICTSVVVPGTGSAGILQPLHNNTLALAAHLHLLFGTTEDKTRCKITQARAQTELLTGPQHCRITARLTSFCSWLGIKKNLLCLQRLRSLVVFQTHIKADCHEQHEKKKTA